MGPKSVRAGRMEYNKALGQSESEQLLLNIVKMRFLDRPVFLNVTSMTSNLSFQSELSTTTTGIFRSAAFPTSAKEGTTKFSVEYGLELRDSSTIVFGTRSMQDILSFASMDVDIPSSMSHLVMPTDINWHKREGSRLLHIKTSSSKPIGSAISIPYKGKWFYIDDDDLQSKATFLLIQVLMGMQSGTTSSGAPVLTIPVSG